MTIARISRPMAHLAVAGRIIITLSLLAGVIHPPAEAAMKPILKLRAGVPPYQIIKDIVDHNRQHKTKTAAAGSDHQQPLVTWLADIDERVSPSLLFPQPAGQVIAVRNLGGQFITAAAAIDVGVLQRLTPLLLICGNTDSRGLRLYFDRKATDTTTAIQTALDHLQRPLRSITAATYSQLDRRTRLAALEALVDYQVDQAVSRYAARVNAGRLAVVGAILDINNAYDLGTNRLLIINVNGETRRQALLRSPTLKTLGLANMPSVGRRAGLLPGSATIKNDNKKRPAGPSSETDLPAAGVNLNR